MSDGGIEPVRLVLCGWEVRVADKEGAEAHESGYGLRVLESCEYALVTGNRRRPGSAEGGIRSEDNTGDRPGLLSGLTAHDTQHELVADAQPVLVRHSLLDSDLLPAGDRVATLTRKANWLKHCLLERLPGGQDEAILKLGFAGQLPRQRPNGAALDQCDSRKILQRVQVARVVELSPTGRRDEYRLHRQLFFF